MLKFCRYWSSARNTQSNGEFRVRKIYIYIYSFINFDVTDLYVTVLYFLMNADTCSI